MSRRHANSLVSSPANAGDGLEVAASASVSAARRTLAKAFRSAGLDSSELDARLLVGCALALDHTALAARSNQSLTAAEAEAINAVAARRLAREPVARILGVKEFWGLPFRVGPATLVPRPETETVIEAALAAIDRHGPRTRALRIADLGTGSGALLVALLRELPGAVGIGTDRSIAALEIARGNAARLAVAPRAQFLACDFAAALGGHLDLVVSNPPYVTSADIAGLASEVKDNDPHLALDGGPDGLDCYRAIARDARRILASNAELIVEIGAGQARAVADLLARSGLAVAPHPRPDLAGIPRALAARQLP